MDPINSKRRRRQLEGWLGCFPTGDGKIYHDEDLARVNEIVDARKSNGASLFFQKELEEYNQEKVIKSKTPSATIRKNAEKQGFNTNIHEFQQWFPDQIHLLAKNSVDKIEASGTITLSFDNEVFSILKNGKNFKVSTANGEFTCKKIILCVGRSGWRWVNEFYKKMGVLVEDDIATYGIRLEMPSAVMGDFNKSHCSFVGEELSVGPLNWFGSVIQEDHADVTIAAFRSNEARWRTDRVFFSLKKKVLFPGEGTKQVDRIAKLAYLLSGDRVGREKLKGFLKKTDQISLIPEYNWLHDALDIVEEFIPNLKTRGYFHVPDIETSHSNKINIASNLETEIEGLFVAGESAGLKGLGAAGISGIVAADSACR